MSKENYEQVEWQFKNKTHYSTNLVRIIKTRDKFILQVQYLFIFLDLPGCLPTVLLYTTTTVLYSLYTLQY